MVGSQGLVNGDVQIGTIMNHYSIARTIESSLGLPPFTANDEYALPINRAFQSSLNASPTALAPGSSDTITVGNGPGNDTDWVGLYAVGTPNTSYLEYEGNI